jgi:hypothetical protein
LGLAIFLNLAFFIFYFLMVSGRTANKKRSAECCSGTVEENPRGFSFNSSRPVIDQPLMFAALALPILLAFFAGPYARLSSSQ